jgi:hypothetical protein
MATTLLPFALIGIWQCQKRALAEVIVWVLAAYSLLGHKEFRWAGCKLAYDLIGHVSQGAAQPSSDSFALIRSQMWKL